ncbi:PREDICTED: kallikrein-14 isoform X2 [Nicrophorus vespilloides]|uniref:Kallikrein-14 isoform X2 n=1 Tax=Nicrophorus vespilloides TaxID=110193 RepID=A0ABM1MWC6_NICVS|nr:PREDICTED: kallikrein-14 isoform X2 [Nicrophorus vespilloides]
MNFIILIMIGIAYSLIKTDATKISTSATSIKLPDTMESQGNVSLYSKWTKWSKCDNCWQNRVKTCISPKCRESRMTEERPCDRKRCLRQKHMKNVQKRLHIFKEIKPKTKTTEPSIWSKWSNWSPCNEQCLTERYKSCKKPGRCKMKQKTEVAYCYLENSNCKFFINQLLYGLNYNGRYEEISPLRTTTEKPRKTRKRKPLVKRCGRVHRKQNMLKIIGGRDAIRDKWPWHVAIFNKFDEMICSGTLVAPRWVLTANHCLRPILIVKINEYDLDRPDYGEKQFYVVKKFPHPKYDKQKVHNDIALLKLPKAVNLPAACLPTREPIYEEQCSIMGWGKLKDTDENGSNILQEAKIPIVNSTTCTRAYQHFSITPRMLCAGYPHGRIDTCGGDSGSGLMCSYKYRGYTVQGITSFGEGCGLPNKYGIYTNVYKYVDWIQQTIKSNRKANKLV